MAVVNQAGANAASVAEMTYALLLSLVKRLDESGAALRAGTGSREALMGREIEGRAIGLVGIGEIGRRVARIAQGFGLTVIACDPLLTAEEIRARARRTRGLRHPAGGPTSSACTARWTRPRAA